ncbi:MAG TPA: YciI family protein [Polyangiaceae bacterium]|jgi:uncharacterized protein YciI
MLALVLISYRVPLDVVAQHTDDHRAYLRTLHAQGKLLASGPFAPRTGGALLLRVEREDEISAIIANDPFHARGVAEHETRVWTPTIGAELFEGTPKS